jgi:hypothetical protein
MPALRKREAMSIHGIEYKELKKISGDAKVMSKRRGTRKQ